MMKTDFLKSLRSAREPGGRTVMNFTAMEMGEGSVLVEVRHGASIEVQKATMARVAARMEARADVPGAESSVDMVNAERWRGRFGD